MATAPQVNFTPESAAAFRDFMLVSIEGEYRTTRRVIENLKDGDWKPDPKSRHALELAWHIAQSYVWFLKSVGQAKFELGGEEPAPTNAADIIKYLDDGHDKYVPAIRKLSGNQLLEVVDFYGMKNPLFVYLDFCKSHTIHHRAQLATYLRPLGGKCPDIYGGSADEPWQGAGS